MDMSGTFTFIFHFNIMKWFKMGIDEQNITRTDSDYGHKLDAVHVLMILI